MSLSDTIPCSAPPPITHNSLSELEVRGGDEGEIDRNRYRRRGQLLVERCVAREVHQGDVEEIRPEQRERESKERADVRQPRRSRPELANEVAEAGRAGRK